MNELKVIQEPILSFEAQAVNIKVTNIEELKNAGDLLFNIKDWIKRTKEDKKELLADFKAGIKKIEAKYDPKLDRAEELKGIVDSEVIAFQLQEIKKREEEEKKKREAELVRLEREKDILESQAAQQNNGKILNEALKVEAKQERLMSEPIVVNKSVWSGYSKTGLRKTWAFTIQDAVKVPAQYRSPDEKLIKQAISNGVREIEGVEIFEQYNTTSR